jgi:predicted ATPase/class 3 adenylate cyclase/DNA-binding CsgD family transcriptional regulator
MTSLPIGTVTFLFTDIEGSTRLLEGQPEEYRVALARHDAIIRQAVAAHAGVVVQSRGDGFCAAFTSPLEAVGAALDSQIGLHEQDWGELVQIKVRMGLHTGEVEVYGEEYFGAPLHRCARLMDSAHGGQTVLSAVTAALVSHSLPPGVWLKDLGEHRLRDLIRSERIYQMVRAGQPTDFSPLRTLTAIPNNLPMQVTAFIGREPQLQAVRATILRSDARLITLTGPGGTGKTRLALQAAADLLDSFPDGVYFVPLASVTDPDLVMSAIAQAFDVREAAGRSLAVSLANAVRQKQVLLLLDNFEQVVAAAPLVADLLAAAPRVNVLVTSRSVLHLYGERELSIPPLALPDHRATPTAAHLAQFESVRLFVDRAQAARSDFVLTDENAPAVGEICQRLDGLPLAIELAAARVRALPPRAMLQRMERRLPLLTGGARDLPARQRTLRDAIGWSYDLLEPDEQALFRRLAVFRGCTLESAEVVCVGAPPRLGATSVALAPLGLDVLDGIESLVEKSLLRREEAAGGQAWFRMLETVREYALERLDESSEGDAVWRRHTLAALRLAESSESGGLGRAQEDWFARLEQEHDNLRAVLSWSEQRGFAQPALRLAAAMWWFWSAHGHVQEGRERVSGLLARFPLTPKGAENLERVELHAKLLWVAGMLASMQGDHGRARALHQESLALRRMIGNEVAVFNSLEGLGTVACFEGDYAAARQYLDEALAVARGIDDPVSSAMALHALGNVENELGNLDAARAYYDASIAQLPADSTLRGPRLSAAAVALDQGRLDEAEALATEALTVFRTQGNRHVEAFALATLGAIALARDDHDGSRDLLTQSILILREHGNVPGIAQVLERFVGLATACGQLEGAAKLAGAAAALRQRGGGPITPSAHVRLDRLLEPVRRGLTEEAFASIWQAGRSLDWDEAVTLALAVADRPPVTPESSPAELSAERPPGAGKLTRRELEVAVRIAQGMTNAEIARALVITEGTAANHVNHILTKLDFNSRAQIAAWAVAQGLSANGQEHGEPRA